MAVLTKQRGIVIAKLTKEIEYLLTGGTRNPFVQQEMAREDAARKAWMMKQHTKLKNALLPKGSIIGRSGKVYSRDRLDRFVGAKKVQVMFKISSFRKTRGDIKNHLDYVTRNGKIPLEDQNGNKITGKGERDELAEQWHDTELLKAQKRAQYLQKTIDERSYPRVAASIVLSMPSGTDREKFAEATRKYCQEEFGDKGYEYLIAFHNDTQHPHAHLLLRLRNLETNRKLNPKKEDLKVWRESLQEKMAEHGLDSVAIPNRLLGKVRSENRKNVHMDWKAMMKAMIAQGIDAKDAEALLKGKAKSRLSEVMNTQKMMSNRQKNLRESVKKALVNPEARNAIERYKIARKDEREMLLHAVSNIAKDIAPGYPEEAGKLIRFAHNLPESEPEIAKLMRSVEKQINRDSVR